MALTADRLKELLDYCPESGVFTWRKTSSCRAVAGSVADNVSANGYIRIGVDGKVYLAHRLAWLWMNGEWPRKYVDHANFVTSDNRWANLREANDAENSRHKRLRSDSRSGVRGVQFHKQSGKWRARIVVDKKSISLGLYPDKISAGAAFQVAATRYYGEFDGVVR